MQIIDSNFNDILIKKTYIALGSFDGLHLGHLELINRSLELARKNFGHSMVYTFENHPLSVVNPSVMPKLLLDNASKVHMLEKIGIDILCLAEFNRELMHMTPEEFIVDLINKYNMNGVIVGFNYRFGYKNQGNVKLLEDLSEKYGFILSVINPLEYDSELVSSSRIRKLVEEGRVEEANKMLYEPFNLRGKVVSGKQLGRKLGYPTANILVDDKFIIPNPGVYYTNIKCNNKLFLGMTNVGFNPTVENTNNINVETYIFNFNKDIYGEDIEVYFIERIRDEIKFSTIDELVLQMKKDYDYVNGKNIEDF